MLTNVDKCKSTSSPLLFTRLDHYYDWILDTTSESQYCFAPHYNESSGQTLSKCDSNYKPPITVTSKTEYLKTSAQTTTEDVQSLPSNETSDYVVTETTEYDIFDIFPIGEISSGKVNDFNMIQNHLFTIIQYIFIYVS